MMEITRCEASCQVQSGVVDLSRGMVVGLGELLSGSVSDGGSCVCALFGFRTRTGATVPVS